MSMQKKVPAGAAAEKKSKSPRYNSLLFLEKYLTVLHLRRNNKNYKLDSAVDILYLIAHEEHLLSALLESQQTDVLQIRI